VTEPNQEGENLAQGDSSADQVYRWTVRALYATAIALNVWMLWDALDESKAEAMKARFAGIRDRLAAPFHERKLFRRQVGHVIYEAMEIVERAEETPADG
jgi:hypothetical protein